MKNRSEIREKIILDFFFFYKMKKLLLIYNAEQKKLSTKEILKLWRWKTHVKLVLPSGDSLSNSDAYTLAYCVAEKFHRHHITTNNSDSLH